MCSVGHLKGSMYLVNARLVVRNGPMPVGGNTEHETIYIYIYGKCLGFARNRNHDWQRIIIIIVIMKPLLKIFNACRSLTGVGELNPYRRSSTNVEV